MVRHFDLYLSIDGFDVMVMAFTAPSVSAHFQEHKLAYCLVQAFLEWFHFSRTFSW